MYIWSDGIVTLSVLNKNVHRHINTKCWYDSLRTYRHANCNKNYFDILTKIQYFKIMAEENIDHNSFSYLKPANSPAAIIFLILLNFTSIMVVRKKAITKRQTNAWIRVSNMLSKLVCEIKGNNFSFLM